MTTFSKFLIKWNADSKYVSHPPSLLHLDKYVVCSAKMQADSLLQHQSLGSSTMVLYQRLSADPAKPEWRHSSCLFAAVRRTLLNGRGNSRIVSVATLFPTDIQPTARTKTAAAHAPPEAAFNAMRRAGTIIALGSCDCTYIVTTSPTIRIAHKWMPAYGTSLYTFGHTHSDQHTWTWEMCCTHSQPPQAGLVRSHVSSSCHVSSACHFFMSPSLLTIVSSFSLAPTYSGFT